MYTTECHLRIFGLRYELTPYFKSLIFKMYICIYNARTTGYLNKSHLLIYIECINDTKKKILENNAKGRKKFNKKWKNVLTN